MGGANLAALGEEAYERHGDRDVLFFEGQWLRSSDLRARTERAAGGFVQLGVAPGDRVIVLMANCPEVGICYSALWRAGAVVTPVIFLLPPEQVRAILVDSEAVAIVTTPEFVATVQQAAVGVETLRSIIVVGAEGGDDATVPWQQLEAADPVPIVARADHDLAALMYTGGTTGRSKGVMLTHENLWYCGKSSEEASYIPGVTRTLSALPLAHAFGLIVSVVGMHSREPGDAVLMRWFEPTEFLDLTESLAIQRATAIPAMLQLLLAQPLEERDLSSWAYVSVGASPLPVEVATEVQRRVPSLTVLEGYGCTESGGVLTVNPADAPRLGTVGRAIPGYEIRVVDDDGNSLPAGEDGEVIARSKGMMAGYWRAPEATSTALRDGWFSTGDIGRLDADGYLTIVDRKKDLIIRNGFNVYPRDVEDELAKHPAVATAAVVGRPDPKVGEEVVAFVQPLPGQAVEPADLVAWAKDHIGGYKYPREVQLVDSIPLTPVMKTDRKALRATLLSAEALD